MATASVTYSFAPLTLAESSEVNQNFQDVITFLNGSTMHRDASSAFTAVPSGPATNPTSANQLARKAYVDVPRYVGSRTGLATVSTGVAGSYVAVAGAGWVTGTSNRITATAAGCTITETGWYEVLAVAEHFIINNTWRGVGIAVNGANLAQDPRGAGVNGTVPTCMASRTMNLTAGQTVAVWHGHDNSVGATMNAYLSVVGVQGTF